MAYLIWKPIIPSVPFFVKITYGVRNTYVRFRTTDQPKIHAFLLLCRKPSSSILQSEFYVELSDLDSFKVDCRNTVQILTYSQNTRGFQITTELSLKCIYIPVSKKKQKQCNVEMLSPVPCIITPHSFDKLCIAHYDILSHFIILETSASSLHNKLKPTAEYLFF